MDLIALNNTHKQICQSLSERKLKPALDLLGELITESRKPLFQEEWRNMEQTYKFMLKYTVEGIRDPERQKIYKNLVVSAFEMNDNIIEDVRAQLSSSFEYEKKRGFNLISADPIHVRVSRIEGLVELQSTLLSSELTISDSGGTLENSRKLQSEIVELFYQVWLTDRLESTDHDSFLNFLYNSAIPESYRAQLVSALVLSLQRFFDPSKFGILFDTYDLDINELSQRALVGILINLYKHDYRLEFYSEITGRLKLLNDQPDFKRSLERVIIQLVRSKETEKLQKKISDEIIPELIKISPNLKDKIDLDRLMEDNSGDDKNPEWEEIFKDSPGLMDKMEEFSELQMEGADVFMSSFSMLKMFPFFSELSNWFVPYFLENPEIASVLEGNDPSGIKILEAIADAPMLCNSDKYSFCFSLQNLPEENREILAEGINAEISQFKEIQKDEELTDPDKMREFVSNQYIQDLYRFYKLHPRKNDFEDVFSWGLDFHNTKVVGGLLKEDDKLMRNLAEYCFSKNQFKEAIEIFHLLLDKEKNGELYQKLGFCYQRLGDYDRALDNYLKADLFDLNRLWNLKKIAHCYRHLRQPEKALNYYQEAETLDPESLNIQLNIGHCFLEQECFEDALKVYFKVEYLDPGKTSVRRPIAWCSFVTGKKEQAIDYFQKVIDENPNKHDYMNMGHVYWSLGDRKQALEYYQRAIAEQDFTESEFFEVFEEDKTHLLEQGVDKEDVDIMLDQLRYFVEESE